MELRHFRLVQAVAEEGTLTAAGRRLCLSQSALSHQLREIEHEVGISLFLRVRKRMVLTPAGERVLASSNIILGEFRRVRDDLARIASGEGGTLRIAACSHTCFHWLPSVLSSYRQTYPGVEIQIDASAAKDPVTHILSGSIDLAIVNLAQKKPGISYTKLFGDEMVALVRSDHPWTRRSYITAKDFSDVNLINYDIPVEQVVFYQRILIPAGITPKSLTRLPMTDTIVEMVRAGMGVAVLNHWSIRSYLQSADLCAIRVTKRGFKRTWYAAVVSDEREKRYMTAFIETLREHGKQESTGKGTRPISPRPTRGTANER